MKKCSSAVWRFFERLEENGRCVAVVCKLCENQYKYFGNTTNLRVHLTTKHPIQWELAQNGTLDSSQFRIEDSDTTEQSTSTPARRKYSRAKKNVRYSVSVDNNEEYEGDMPKIEIQRVDVLEHSDIECVEDNVATINLVKQMHNRNSGEEEWLDDDPYQITHIETYEPVPKRKNKMKYRRVKREVQSPSGLPGFYVAPKPEKTVIYEDVNQNDEYSVFGEYVANKLRKVKTQRTRGNLQQLITTILWQAEYGMYDNADAVKRVLMYSVQSPEPEPSTVDFSGNIQINDMTIHNKDIEEPNQSIETESLVVISNDSATTEVLRVLPYEQLL